MELGTTAGSLLTLAETRQRLAALRAELDRLDHDRSVFARAFHTQVARSVAVALAEEETRLAALPAVDLTTDSAPGTTTEAVLDDDPWLARGTGRTEILDL